MTKINRAHIIISMKASEIKELTGEDPRDMLGTLEDYEVEDDEKEN